ncbi:hypothetical protein LEP1GSC040_3226 [Leptospira santarosai str. 2000030832]|uniref:Uncharacterized protein n=1 Tax=Leptospira santarosai serovar Arenal str. MAVJ 401 TaxID=1049976 RepID=M6JCK6_9LEPT|nr:hypothetical protein LEP1GSC040_3226 [Leptospira santarosai str. 2000030832]EMN19579.1 hypothetical protein LEP1GSC063_1559 [Leptospira santarosai serovar Arenal str. MAVJ 401]
MSFLQKHGRFVPTFNFQAEPALFFNCFGIGIGLTGAVKLKYSSKKHFIGPL